MPEIEDLKPTLWKFNQLKKNLAFCNKMKINYKLNSMPSRLKLTCFRTTCPSSVNVSKRVGKCLRHSFIFSNNAFEEKTHRTQGQSRIRKYDRKKPRFDHLSAYLSARFMYATQYLQACKGVCLQIILHHCVKKTWITRRVEIFVNPSFSFFYSLYVICIEIEQGKLSLTRQR